MNTGEKEKEISQTVSNVLLLEVAIHYIKEFQVSLKGSDSSVGTSVETDAPNKLSSERDPLDISKQGPRNRINAALKEIESLIPSEFIQVRLAKDNAISSVNPESNVKEKSLTQGHSKATIVEMAVDYIREMQENLVRDCI